MKCIYCQRDSRKSERFGGVCPGCGKAFAFDPSTQGQPTDPAFQAAIDRVSGTGTVRFTDDNLYFELARTKFGKKGSVIGCLPVLMIPVLGFLGIAVTPWLLLVALALFVGVAIWKPKETPLVTLSHGDFGIWLGLWKGAHGLPAGLIQPRTALPAAEHIQAMRAELEQYSFDRAVICDRRETVDLLLANNFHFENNCAILSIDGYPASVFDLVLAMLKRNPKLHIFALHDATLAGCSMAHRLATDPAWFVGQGPIFDVGLRPAHAAAFHGLWQDALPHERKAPCPPGVTQEEYAWLRHFRLSLAAVRPEQVIKRLFRAISERKADPTSFDNGDSTALATRSANSERVTRMDTVIFASDAGASDGGGDSFG